MMAEMQGEGGLKEEEFTTLFHQLDNAEKMKNFRSKLEQVGAVDADLVMQPVNFALMLFRKSKLEKAQYEGKVKNFYTYLVEHLMKTNPEIKKNKDKIISAIRESIV